MITNYILVWRINDYPDNGGGIQYQTFETLADIDKEVDTLLEMYGDKFEIEIAGELKDLLTYKPIEVIKKLGRV